MSKIVYFACPYSHKDKEVVKERVEKATKVVAKLVSEGNVVISPIIYGDLLLKHHEMPDDWQFWKNFCETFLSKCDKMIVYMLPEWNHSTGVLAEIDLARKLGIRSTFYQYNMKLDFQEINHNYITRLVVFSIFLFKEKRRVEPEYFYLINNFLKKRVGDIGLHIEVGPKMDLEDQRDKRIESLLDDTDSDFLNLVVVQFKTGLKEVVLQINLNHEDRYESYLYH